MQGLPRRAKMHSQVKRGGNDFNAEGQSVPDSESGVRYLRRWGEEKGGTQNLGKGIILG